MKDLSLENIILDSDHLLDVRSPVEFQDSSLPDSINIPILENHEREVVGTTYKHDGKDAAITLGHQLVSGEIKQSRINSWCKAIKNKNLKYITCARGGLRSQITCAWLKEQNIELYRVPSGYKSLRAAALNILQSKLSKPLLVISGRTGVGKTKFLEETKRPVINLEKLANHRGSAFGWRETPQPTQASFENLISKSILQNNLTNSSFILIEAESERIGRLRVPKNIYMNMLASNVVVINESLDFRLELLLNDYVREPLSNNFSVNSILTLKNNYLRSLQGISKKLGDARFKVASEILTKAFDKTDNFEALDLHKEWIYYLLENYYDTLYDRYYQEKKNLVVFEGSYIEAMEYVNGTIHTI